MRTERLAAASGAGFVAAAIIGNAMETSGIRGTLLDHLRAGRSPVQATGLVLELVGFALSLVFLGYLYRVQREAEAPGGWAASAAFGAGLVATAIKLGSASAVVAAYYRADALSPELARTLDDLNGGAFVVSGFAYGLFVALAAGSALGSRGLPRWLAIGGLVAGVLATAAGVAGVLDPAGFVAVPFMLCLVWILVTGIVLTVRRPELPTRIAERAPDPVAAEPTASA